MTGLNGKFTFMTTIQKQIKKIMAINDKDKREIASAFSALAAWFAVFLS